MSKKFHDRLVQGSGVSAKKFRSSYGEKLLSKYGWEDGKGLGKEEDGERNCLQIRRREENTGLGTETIPKNDWNNWWDTMYNSVAGSIKVDGHLSSDDDDDDVRRNNSDSLLEVCEGRTGKKADRQKGKLARIKTVEQREKTLISDTTGASSNQSPLRENLTYSGTEFVGKTSKKRKRNNPSDHPRIHLELEKFEQKRHKTNECPV